MGRLSFLLVSCVLEADGVDEPIGWHELSVEEGVVVLIWEWLHDFLSQDINIEGILAQIVQIGVSRFASVVASSIPVVTISLYKVPISISNV